MLFVTKKQLSKTRLSEAQRITKRRSLYTAIHPILEQLEGRQLFSTAKPLPFSLNFSSDQGGVLDKNGLGTGFTDVQPNKNGTQYQPSLINLDTADGLLKITTTGTSSAGSNSLTDNTQVDALQTQFDATTGAWEVDARLKGPLSNLTANYDQGGIYFGPDQDNFVKLVVVHSGSNNILQFKDEINAGNATLPSSVQNVNIGDFSKINTLDLRLIGNPASGKISAYYAVNGGAFTKLASDLTLSATNKAKWFTAASRAGILASAKNDLPPITVAFDSFGISASTVVSTSHPSATEVRPRDGATAVSRDSFIAVDLNLPNSGIDPATLSGNVLLYRTSDHKAIAGVVNTSGGGDAIVFQPSDFLDSNTSYTFQITAGVKDTSGATFVPFTSSFTTGTGGGNDGSMSFQQLQQSASQGQTYTCVTVGPDHKLYATTIDGLILRFTINADGTLSNPQTITTIQDNNGGPEAITSIAFDPSSTANNLIAWVSHSAPSLTNAPDWSGKISKLTGANLQTYQNEIVGLPRSIRDHMNNQIVFGPDGKLYFAQAANNAMGAPDKAWGMRPDHLLNDAILQVDITKLPTNGPLNVQTDGVANPYNPFAPNAPLKIYADGVRNSFDLLFATNGHLYASVNGSAAGGNTPASPNPAFSNDRIDEGVYGDYNGPAVPGITNNTQTEHDWLDDIIPGKYYGHPNPSRDEWVMNGGNPTSGTDPFEVPQYPVGTQPDRNYMAPVYDYGENMSPDGMIQYSGSAFGGALNGKILVVRYSGGDDIEVLTPNADGSIQANAQTGIAGARGFTDPVDLTEDNSTGFIYVAEYGGQRITLVKPLAQGGNVKVSQSTLYLNDVKSGSTDPGSTGKSQSLVITNNGTGPLTLNPNSFTITGPNAVMFSVSAANLPTTLQPGDSYTLIVNFIATNVGIDTATLTINTNSANNPAISVALRGIGMTGTEVANGLNEPSLQRILDLYQIPDNVGDDDSTTTAFPATPVAGNDEVTMQQLLKAGDGNVSIQLLSVFANIKDPAIHLGTYNPGTPDSASDLFTVAKSDAQSVNPTAIGTTTFDPGSRAFDLYATFPAFTNRDSYQEDALNTWDTTNPRKLRFYALKNADGSVVPNAYVFAFEDYNKAYDFNDVVGIIRNVKAAPPGPYIGTDNLDGGLYNQLTMSRIQNLDARVPNVTHNVASLQISNTGSQALTISSVVLSGPYTFVSGGSTTSIAAGGTATVKVQFNGVGADMVDVMNGTLTINSNAVNQPITTIALSGLYQKYSEQSPTNAYSEPTLQQIVNAFGYTTNVANPNQETVNGDEVKLGNGGQGAAVGEEILSAYWQQADSNAPVAVQMLAAYHKESGQDTLGNAQNTFSSIKYYYQGTSTSTTTLFTHNQNEGQTILPHLNGSTTKYAAATFSPSSGKAFGFKVDGDYTDDSLNNPDWDHSDPNQTPIPNTGHSIRFYALKDANGNVIPNTYLMAQDYTGISYSNYDYQDNIYIVTNVKPLSPPATPAGATASAAATGINLAWTANSEGNIAGYRVYRSDSATGTFTLLNTTSLLTSTNFSDVSAPAGATSYYRITAVNLNGNESSYASISATAPAGDGGTTVTINAPTNLQITNVTGSEVDLSWTDNSTNESGFEIQRQTPGGSFTTIFTTNANVTTFSDTAVTAGQTYAYQVVATDGTHESAASNSQSASVTAPAPTAPNSPSGLTASADSAGIHLNWTETNANETLLIERSVGNDSSFTTLTTLGAATGFTDQTATPGTFYFYRISATTSGGTSAPSNEASTTAVPPAQAPLMNSSDIGGVTPAGTTTTITNGSDYDVIAGGANIWGTSDQFRFVYQQMTGNFDVKVQVLSILDNDPKAKAGIMARASLSANAANAFARINAEAINGPRLSYRTTTGGSSITAGSGDGGPMIWVRLQRVGNTFTMYRSPDGTTWTSVGSTTIAMGSTIYVGMATAADTAGETTTAQYRSFGNTVSAPVVTVPAAPSNLTNVPNTAQQVDLGWQDNSNNETGFKIVRRSDTGPAQVIFTTAANATSWSDTNVLAGTTYYYQIIATNSAGDSTPTAEFSVMTPPAAPALPTFTSTNIGNSTPAGNSTNPATGQYTVTGSGSDVWGTSDQTQFDSTQLTGNFDIQVQVNSATFAAGQNPLLGLMARDTLNANAKNIFMRTYGVAGQQYKFASRTSTGGTTTSVTGGNNSYPNTWLRLTRVGNVFTGYSSNDGVTWTMTGTTTVAMGSTIYVGMAVTSRSMTSTATAQFSNLSIA